MRRKLIIAFTTIIIITLSLTIINYKTILAFLTNKDKTTNNFTVGELKATVTEPNYEDNQTVKPGEEIIKDPTLSNIGEVEGYIRAQVYVPVSKEIKYVDENEKIIIPEEEIEIATYKINEGWEEVTEEGFSGIYEDKEGNKYKVHTYKYMENGQERIIKPEETIEKPLFNKVKIINYLDMDKTINIKIHVAAISVQSEGGTAEEMWTYYKNQNGTGIVGVEYEEKE